MEVWIGREGERYGPYQEEDVRQWLRSGQVSRDDLGWREGLADWQPLSALFPDIEAAPPSAVPPPMGAPPSAAAPAAAPASAEAGRYASFWQRFGAWAIDYLILLVPSLIIAYAMGTLAQVEQLMAALQGGGDTTAAMTAYVVAMRPVSIVIVLLGYAYYVLFECSKWQATPGKLALDLRVAGLQDGQRLSLGRSAGRNAVRLLNIVTGLIPFVCYVAVAWTQRRQGLHDLLAGTVVLNGRVGRPAAPVGERRDGGGSISA
jgi:uncharacterized RDD family membrane protein YckC